MATVEHGFKVNPLIGLMARLCSWNKIPSGIEEDFHDLMRDPVVRLSREAFEFPRIGLWLYVIWLPLLVIAEGLVVILIYEKAKNIAVVVIACMLGVGIFLGYLVGNFVLLRRRLQLDAIGFHVIQGRNDTLVPWTCIQCEREWSVDLLAVKIPVVATAKDKISVNSHGITRTISAGATPVGLQFNNDAEITLFWPFQIHPERFAFVAQEMYSAILSGHDRLPEAATTRFGVRFDALPAGVQILSNGLIQVPTTAVTFPDNCCHCDAATDSFRNISVRTFNDWWIPSRMGATVEIPVCNRCWSSSWRRILTVLAVT